VDDLEICTVVCALVPARNAGALTALLSAHLPIPDLRFLKRVRSARAGEYPELFAPAAAAGVQEDAVESHDSGASAGRADEAATGGESRGDWGGNGGGGEAGGGGGTKVSVVP